MVASTQQQLYSYAAEPRAVQNRPKYRDEEAMLAGSANLMFDRRVVRGNTYAARIVPAEPTLAPSKPASTKRATLKMKPPATPEPVEGRKHTDIQTDAYLEELTDVMPEADNSTQTDAFLDRPPTPVFVPRKTGADATTQIETGELFHFDYEVDPILEVVVGKVLEQSLMEVVEEEELAAMKAAQAHFEQIRHEELVITQRMEAAEIRKTEERSRRVAQEQARVGRERSVRVKVAASTFARGYLNGIVDDVFEKLQESGYFFDPVEREVESRFLPWLKEAAAGYLAQGVIARRVVQQLVGAAVQRLQAEKAAAAEAIAAQFAAAEAYEAATADAAAAKAAAELDTIRTMATYVLTELNAIPADKIEAARGELTAKAEEEANGKWEEAKAKAAEDAKAEAEAKVAEQKERLEAEKAAAEEAAAAAAAAAEAAGEEPPAPAEPAEPTEALLNEEWVEAQVAAAKEAVAKPPVREISDGDVMSALIEKGDLSKDAIVSAMVAEQLRLAALAEEAEAKERAKFDAHVAAEKAAAAKAAADAAAAAAAAEAPAAEAPAS